MMGGRSWDDWIEEYSHSHEHPVNRLTHSFGIPMIALSILMIPVCFFVSNLWMIALGHSSALLVVSWPGLGFLRSLPQDRVETALSETGLMKDQAKMLTAAQRTDVISFIKAPAEEFRQLFGDPTKDDIRPGFTYAGSLELLARARAWLPEGCATKSNLILGMGEERDEVLQTMADLRAVGVELLTITQYLQPTREHLNLQRFVPPEEFAELRTEAEALGFAHVESGPLVRSSYHADLQAQQAGAA